MMKEQAKYKIPDGYFNSLKKDLKNIPDQFPHSEAVKHTYKYLWYLAAACLIPAMFIVFNSTKNETPALTELSDGQIISYLETQPDILVNDNIYLENISFEEIEANLDDIDDDDLENYLNNFIDL